jgi:hypothetical protein
MIAVADGRRFLLQIANILVVQINIHKRPQLAFIGIKMTTQIGMLRNQATQGLPDIAPLDLNSRLLARILPQRRRNMDLWHVQMMPQEGNSIQLRRLRTCVAVLPQLRERDHAVLFLWLMNSTKQDVEQLLHKLPDDCSIEDIQYHLYVLDKVRRGLEDARMNGTVPQEETESRLGKWLTE